MEIKDERTWETCSGGEDNRLGITQGQAYARDIPGANYKWSCPVCGRDKWWVTRAKDLSWAIHGGGISVCRRCEKTRKDEIDEHNWIYHGKPGAEENRDCDHEWIEPYLGRWYCPNCHGQVNMMCGCGGSMYCCNDHYNLFVAANKPFNEWLAAHAHWR